MQLVTLRLPPSILRIQHLKICRHDNYKVMWYWHVVKCIYALISIGTKSALNSSHTPNANMYINIICTLCGNKSQQYILYNAEYVLIYEQEHIKGKSLQLCGFPYRVESHACTIFRTHWAHAWRET